MAIPFVYNLRHVRVRFAGAAMTAAGIALATTILVVSLALPRGLERVLEGSGDPENLVVLRKGAQSETMSAITREAARLIATLPEIAADEEGAPLASPETIVLVNTARRDGRKTNLLLRGLAPGAVRLRPKVRLVEGRWFRPGLAEAVASRSVAGRFANLGLRETLRFGRHDWTVVGLFDAQGEAADSEVWVDADLLMGDFRRDDYSSVLVRTASPEASARLVRTLDEDKRLSLRGVVEPQYYREQTRDQGIPLQFVGMFIAVLLAVGACFGAMNTMYAAVASRAREIAVLRSLGFRRRAVLLSFLVEGLALSFLGGLLGCAFALPFHGLATGTTNWRTFSEIAFRFQVTPDLLLAGLVFACAVGLLGTLFPARLAASRPIAASMRAL